MTPKYSWRISLQDIFFGLFNLSNLIPGVHCFIVLVVVFFFFQKTLLKEEVDQLKVRLFYEVTQPVFTCSKLTIETLEQGVKYVQS